MTLGGSDIQSLGSTTLACLSCHDGVTTFDNLVNAPGKGGVAGDPHAGTNMTWYFRMPYPESDADSGWDKFTAAQCGACHYPGNGLSQNRDRLIIGFDLSNDHPVSVVYNGGVAGLREADTVISTIDLTSDLASAAATAFDGNLMQNRWAVNGFITSTATIGDLLRDGRVECTSCHDPHFRNLSWDEAEPTWADGEETAQGYSNDWCNKIGENCSDGQFLRRVGGNTGSALCRTCHDK